MRAITLALLALLVLDGCMNRPAQRDRSNEVSYNRRELPPSPGLFTGPDGVWTVYRSGEESTAAPAEAETANEPEPEAPRRREVLLCDHGSQYCEQPDEPR